MRRDLSRGQVKSVIRKGLAHSGGSYHRLLDNIGHPKRDYQRFMDFLRHHNLKP
jgi:hypothetical protein